MRPTITLRGKPGWGENMACLSTLIHTFRGCWFDMQWKPQIDSPEWKNAITCCVDLIDPAARLPEWSLWAIFATSQRC
jgi:hypothetical protein